MHGNARPASIFGDQSVRPIIARGAYGIYKQYPQNADNIHKMRIYTQNMDNIHREWRYKICGQYPHNADKCIAIMDPQTGN